MIDLFLYNQNFVIIVASTLLLGMASGIMGSINFWSKKSLIAEVLTHAMLPGIVIAYALTLNKSPYILVTGAFISAYISSYLVAWISRNSNLSKDAVMAIILSSFFGLGTVLLVYIQDKEYDVAGLDAYLFGQTVALNAEDLVLISITFVVVLLVSFYNRKRIILYTYNRDYFNSLGFSERKITLIINFLTVLVLSVGIKTVGIILMSAFLISSAAASSFWNIRVTSFIIISCMVSSLSVVGGSIISNSFTAMPAGPWIVVFLFGFTFLSALLNRNNGLIIQYYNQLNNSILMNVDHIVKDLYYKLKDQNRLFYLSEIKLSEVNFLKKWMIVNLLKSKKYIQQIEEDRYLLTKKGFDVGLDIYKKHCIWELYLKRKLHIKEEFIHVDADNAEHYIDDDVKELIYKELNICENYMPIAEIHH